MTQAQTIHGLGGIGKTRLAVEYAWRSGSQYDTAVFVVAETPEALHSNLANLARPEWLNLPESKAPAQEETVAAVLRWLREHDRWLLILDNVDTQEAKEAVLKVLPSLSTGRVLITSRVREWPPSVQRQPLETLSLDEAQRFLLERTASDRIPSEDDPVQALRLAEELGGLPLALEQAAAYIVHHQMSLSDYLDDWQHEREQVLNWYDESVMQYPASVAVTWQKTFQQLSPTAASILRLTAYLAPDPIPSEMFEKEKSIVEEAMGLWCEETGAQPNDQAIRTAIAELAAYSMVTREGPNFTVHRMVQDVLRSKISEGRRRDWIERSLRLVNGFSPLSPDDIHTWPTWDLLRTHILLVLKYSDDIGIAHPTALLMNELSVVLHGKGLYKESKSLRERVVVLLEATLDPNDVELSIALDNLAVSLVDEKRFVEAEPLMRRALKICENALGFQHPSIAIHLNNLAQLLKATNQLEYAEPLMRRALQIDENSFGPHHPKVAIRLNNLASLLYATNRSEDAEPLMQRALQIDENSLGPHHPNVTRNLNNLARLLQATNRLADAEPLMRRAVEICESSLGADHPTTQIFRTNLAALLQEIASRTESDPSE